MTEPIWVFDVDACLVDSLTGTSLRPGAANLLAELRSRGSEVLLWSAGGAEYAQRRAAEQGIEGLFDAFHGKDRRDADGRYLTDGLATGVAAVIFVDDRPEDLPAGVDIIAVSPYLSDDKHDRGLARVAERAGVELLVGSRP